MRAFRRPRCPYCGDRLNAAQTWALRRRGEYICPKCGGLSNVATDPRLRALGYLAVLAGAALFTAGFFLPEDDLLTLLAGVLLPFLIFYLACFGMIRLKRPRRRQRQAEPARAARRSPQSEK